MYSHNSKQIFGLALESVFTLQNKNYAEQCFGELKTIFDKVNLQKNNDQKCCCCFGFSPKNVKA